MADLLRRLAASQLARMGGVPLIGGRATDRNRLAGSVAVSCNRVNRLEIGQRRAGRHGCMHWISWTGEQSNTFWRCISKHAGDAAATPATDWMLDRRLEDGCSDLRTPTSDHGINVPALVPARPMPDSLTAVGLGQATRRETIHQAGTVGRLQKYNPSRRRTTTKSLVPHKPATGHRHQPRQQKSRGSN